MIRRRANILGPSQPVRPRFRWTSSVNFALENRPRLGIAPAGRGDPRQFWTLKSTAVDGSRTHVWLSSRFVATTVKEWHVTAPGDIDDYGILGAISLVIIVQLGA